MNSEDAARIYFLPNLMTAGNLFCGFVAVSRCIQARLLSTAAGTGEALLRTPEHLYQQAVLFILAAVIFDSLDGRLARLGGRESLFGKEFDSLADVVSFGVAPALLVFLLILSPTEGYPTFRQLGFAIAFIYLLCVAVRLARFNVITHPALVRGENSSPKDRSHFRGLPAPAAAGVISSLVLIITREDHGWMALFMPSLLLLTSILMVSNVRYPSFKQISWSLELRVRSFIILLVILVVLYLFKHVGFALVFISYLFYGLYGHVAKRRRLAPIDVDDAEESGE